MKQKAYFMHIPKCGGTSIHQLMDSNFDYEKIAKSAGGLFSPESEKFLLADFDLYHEHSNIIERVTGDVSCFTILRDPKSRLISLMNHWLDWSKDEILSGSEKIQDLKFEMQEKGFLGFFESNDRRILNLFKNGMSKSLIDNSKFKRGVYDINLLSEDELLMEAKSTIDRLDFVGLVESFSDSIVAICDLYSWTPPQEVIHTNKRDSHHLDISEELAHRIEEYTKVDALIYEYGVEKFMSYMDKLNKKYEKETLNRNLTQNSLKKFRFEGGKHQTVTIEMEHAHASSGFHEREGMDINSIYRWAGQSDESKLYFSLPRYESEITVEVYSISRMNDEMFQSCQFYLNGELAQNVQFKERDGNLDVFLLTFRHVPFQYGVGEFCIYAPLRISHQDLDKNCPDKRKKSIAVNRIKVIGK